MAHRREQIMQAVLTNLTGLATTGANVSRFRAHSITALPFITIEQGTDEVVERDFIHLHRRADVLITLTVAGPGVLATQINQISAEVFSALQASHTQGLNFVIDTQLEQESGIEINNEQDQPTAQVQLTWSVIYRHSATSTES